MDDLADHFDWQLLHNRIRLGSTKPQEVDRFIFMDCSLRSQLEGIPGNPAYSLGGNPLEFLDQIYPTETRGPGLL